MFLKKIDYVPFLESCWQEHLLPKGKDAPTVISTFAGCGGSSLGYSMAGFRELLATDFDEKACETFKLNFPDIPILLKDIKDLTGKEILDFCKIKSRELDVLDGSPPCQGFSIVRKRQFSDNRNSLFHEFVRLIRELQPKTFVMENVTGMVKGVMKIIFSEAMRELRTSGYQVSARILNAQYFNVPQSRTRLIFVGVRNDLGIEPSHPKAQSCLVSVRDAILQNERTNTKTLISEEGPAPRLTSRYIKYWRQACQGQSVGPFCVQKKLSENRPSFVLCKEGSTVFHPTEARGVSIGERKRLASFPEAFVFIDWKSAKELIGNCVPPLFMRSIALHIRHNILEKALGKVSMGSKGRE